MTGKIAKMATKTSSKSVYIVSSPKCKCFTDTDGRQWELSLTFPINGYVKKLLKRRSILTHTHTHTMTTVSLVHGTLGIIIITIMVFKMIITYTQLTHFPQSSFLRQALHSIQRTPLLRNVPLERDVFGVGLWGELGGVSDEEEVVKGDKGTSSVGPVSISSSSLVSSCNTISVISYPSHSLAD